MHFDSLFSPEQPGNPAFNRSVLIDTNPLGGTVKRRVIYAPNDAMRDVHAKLISALRYSSPRMPSATGAVPGGSPARNVRAHRQQRYFFLLDLKDAYRNVQRVRLGDILLEVFDGSSGDRTRVMEFLRRFCLAPEGGLAIGAPASPDLFNLYAEYSLDREMRRLAEQYDLTYTRYLDDLTFSSADWPIGSRKRQRITRIITQAGFTVNHSKAKVYDLHKGPIVINGVGLKPGGKLFLPRHYLRKIRGLLHRAEKCGDVNPNTIHGMMGLFLDITRPRLLTSAEKKLVTAYYRFKRNS